MNPGFGLGIIVKARVEDGWDLRKEQYTDELYRGIAQKVQQTQTEAVGFAVDAMAAFHKMAGGHFRKYLQTGDKEDLGPYKDYSFRSYQEFVNLALKLTGQEGGPKKAQPAVHVHVNDSPAKVVGSSSTMIPVTATDSDTLEFLANNKEEIEDD